MAFLIFNFETVKNFSQNGTHVQQCYWRKIVKNDKKLSQTRAIYLLVNDNYTPVTLIFINIIFLIFSYKYETVISIKYTQIYLFLYFTIFFYIFYSTKCEPIELEKLVSLSTYKSL